MWASTFASEPRLAATMPTIASSESVKSSLRPKVPREMFMLAPHKELRVRKRSELNKFEILREFWSNYTKSCPEPKGGTGV